MKAGRKDIRTEKPHPLAVELRGALKAFLESPPSLSRGFGDMARCLSDADGLAPGCTLAACRRASRCRARIDALETPPCTPRLTPLSAAALLGMRLGFELANDNLARIHHSYSAALEASPLGTVRVIEHG